MADRRDVYRGAADEAVFVFPPERPAHDRSLTEDPGARRARYLAKAASLGQVVLDDGPPAVQPHGPPCLD